MNLHQSENHQGEPEDKGPRSTAMFPSVLIALVALGVMAWVGVKLMQPSPVPPVTSRSVEPAASTQELPEKTVKISEADADGSSNNIALASNETDPICGMNPQRSAMRVEAEFADGDIVAFDSLACYYEYVETMADTAPVAERIVAFDTYRLESPVLLSFNDAIWLIDLDGSVPGAMPPGAAAFRTEEDAKKAMGNLGGKLASVTEMKTYVYYYLQENGILN